MASDSAALPALNRRDFLKAAAVEGAAAAAAVATAAMPGQAESAALQREPHQMPQGALGLLYDSTLCIGCRACQTACKTANNMPQEIPAGLAEWNTGTWDSPEDLSGHTLTVIKVYQNHDDPAAEMVKDREINGFAFIKRQCNHCVDASCVSVCPVSAMVKDPVTGVVSHHPERCIGCRYCVLACPFRVPRYQFDRAFGRITKCQLCTDVPGRTGRGGFAACADACPTGATLFGPVTALREEARARLGKQPGEPHHFPRGSIEPASSDGRPSHEAPIAAYYHGDQTYRGGLYGERELGGVQCMTLAGVPFQRLGLPTDVPDYGYATLTEGIQHTLYRGMIAPAALLAGLGYLAYRSGHHKHETEDSHQ